MTRKSPKDKPAKDAVVAFKVERELAEILDKLPNKSAFIREAIEAALGKTCPLCKGKGVVQRGIHDHYEPLIKANASRPCDGCGDALAVPRDVGELDSDGRSRLEQFFRGGPLYCDPCYDKAPACDDCGWHIDADHVQEHVKATHGE